MFKILDKSQLDSSINSFLHRKSTQYPELHIQTEVDGPVHSIRSRAVEGKGRRDFSAQDELLDELFIFAPAA